MRKVIAAFNITLDGVSDHTAGIADEGLHQHYAELIDNAGVIVYGRTTFQLMQFWQELLKKPSGEKAMDDFARAIDNIPKLVFSNTMDNTGWDSAKLAKRALDEEILALKQQSGKDILIGSKSLIIQLLNSHCIDEFQICIHPVLEGKGELLFTEIKDRILLKLIKTKSLNSGSIILYYQPTKISFTPFPILSTERLTLRQLSIDDGQHIFALRSDKEINKYLDRQPNKTIDDALNFINKINESIKDNKAMYWAITLTNNKTFVGTICLFNFSNENNTCEIGFELLTNFQGQGIMNEAIRKVIIYAFQSLQLKSIEGYTHNENQRSIELLTKIGFKKSIETDTFILTNSEKK